MLTRIAGQTMRRALAFPGSRHLARNAAAASRSYSRATAVRMAAMDDLKTGTSAYMDLYPEQSTDGGLRLGNIVPDFAADTTHGQWDSFHEWKKGKVRTKSSRLTWMEAVMAGYRFGGIASHLILLCFP